MANHMAVYKSGEKLRMESGECLEKSYVCWNGSIQDEGMPATPIKGCRKTAGEHR